ncbi:MAG TPA: Ig-like domain repeat protein [Bacillales bacterium]|nr:Ig-like domain repeat protein [Bacillales bacterium]
MGKRLQKNLAVLTAVLLGVLTSVSTTHTANADDGTSAYPNAPGARAAYGGAYGTELFLGGNYIELGISNWGDLGTEGPKPSHFRGTNGSYRVGMSADFDGYGKGYDLPIDYYLPGTPEERFAVGYKVNGAIYTNSNSALMRSKNMPTTVTNESKIEEGLLKANIESTWSSRMKVSQVISFNVNDKFYRNEVTLTNLTAQTWDSARYMRSFDPDNTVFAGSSYTGFTTVNTVTKTVAEDGKAVVKAEAQSNDRYYQMTGSRAPFFFYSNDPAARASIFGFLNTNPYDPRAYDAPTRKGQSITSDIAITMTWDSGQLAPGESKTFTYYSSLDERDFDDVIKEIEKDTTAPVTTDNAPTEWQNHDFSIDLTAIDDESGVDQTYYAVDNGDLQTGTSVSIDTEGVHTVSYYSVDKAGNQEAGHTVTVKLDKTAPETTDNAPTSWQNHDFSIDLSASDDESGVVQTYYTIDNGDLQTGTSVSIHSEGVHTVKYYSVDQAGNQEASHTITVKLDKTTPTLSVDLSKTMLWSPNHKMVPIDASVDADDESSGVASVVLRSITSNEADQVNNGDKANDIQNADFGTNDTTFALRAERLGKGTGRIYKITYTVTDKAGNSTSVTQTVEVPHDQGKHGK